MVGRSSSTKHEEMEAARRGRGLRLGGVRRLRRRLAGSALRRRVEQSRRVTGLRPMAVLPLPRSERMNKKHPIIGTVREEPWAAPRSEEARCQIRRLIDAVLHPCRTDRRRLRAKQPLTQRRRHEEAEGRVLHRLHGPRQWFVSKLVEGSRRRSLGCARDWRSRHRRRRDDRPEIGGVGWRRQSCSPSELSEQGNKPIHRDRLRRAVGGPLEARRHENDHPHGPGRHPSPEKFAG